MNEWTVKFTAKSRKQYSKLPKKEKEAVAFLLTDLTEFGAVQPNWSNYSKLDGYKYHCHLSYKWVACWSIENKEIRLIEIYYLGSRENAPY